MRPIFGGLHKERRELGALLEADSIDTTAVHNKIEKIAELQQELSRKVTFHLIKEKSLLPEEFRDEYMEFMKRRMGMGRYSSGRRKEKTTPDSTRYNNTDHSECRSESDRQRVIR